MLANKLSGFKKNASIVPGSVDAVLIKTISYNKDGIAITVRAGTSIKVDLIKGVALVNGDHMDIGSEEYEVTL